MVRAVLVGITVAVTVRGRGAVIGAVTRGVIVTVAWGVFCAAGMLVGVGIGALLPGPCGVASTTADWACMVALPLAEELMLPEISQLWPA